MSLWSSLDALPWSARLLKSGQEVHLTDTLDSTFPPSPTPESWHWFIDIAFWQRKFGAVEGMELREIWSDICLLTSCCGIVMAGAASRGLTLRCYTDRGTMYLSFVLLVLLQWLRLFLLVLVLLPLLSLFYFYCYFVSVIFCCYDYFCVITVIAVIILVFFRCYCYYYIFHDYYSYSSSWLFEFPCLFALLSEISLRVWNWGLPETLFERTSRRLHSKARLQTLFKNMLSQPVLNWKVLQLLLLPPLLLMVVVLARRNMDEWGWGWAGRKRRVALIAGRMRAVAARVHDDDSHSQCAWYYIWYDLTLFHIMCPCIQLYDVVLYFAVVFVQ